MSSDRSGRTFEGVVSRRRLLSATGAAGVAALAGCSDDAGGGPENGGNGDGDGSEQEVPDHADTYFRTADGEHQIGDFQYNPHQWAGYSHIQFALFAEWAQYIVDEDEYYPHAIEDWEIGDTSMTLEVSDEFSWGDGDPVDAHDVVMQLDLGEALDDDLFDFVDDYEATDDHTVEITYEEGTNQDIIRHVVLDRPFDHPPADWGDIHEAQQDGEDVTDEMFGNEIAEPTPSGPIDLGDTSEQQARFEVRDDHHLSENFNWNGYEMEYRSGNQEFHQSFANQELDGVHSLFAGPGALEQFPDTLEQIQIPGGFGLGITFNHDHEHYGDREVRQAFAHAVDISATVQAVGADTKIELPFQSGLTAPATEEWHGDGADYRSYDTDQQQVDELLQEAGYERNDDDVWERDGEELPAEIVVPQGWSDWVTMVSSLVDQLSQAGFAAELDSRDQGVWDDALSTGDFGVAAYNHAEGGNAAMNHPYFAFSWKFENRQHASPNFYNYPEDETITVPDGDGGEIDVNPREELETIANTNDDATLQESIDRLTRLFNEDLPMLQIVEKYEQSFIDRDGWQFPSQDESQHFQTFWPLYWLPKQDELKATVDAE